MTDFYFSTYLGLRYGTRFVWTFLFENVGVLPGILGCQYPLSAHCNPAGQEHQQYPSLPSRHHFLQAHGDPVGQADLHTHKSEWKDQAKNSSIALRHISHSHQQRDQIGFQWQITALCRRICTIKSIKLYIYLYKRKDKYKVQSTKYKSELIPTLVLIMQPKQTETKCMSLWIKLNSKITQIPWTIR